MAETPSGENQPIFIVPGVGELTVIPSAYLLAEPT